MNGHPTLPSRFAAGRPAFGMFVKVPALENCEIIARSGIDFVVIDTEHACLSVRDVYQMIVVFTSLGVPAVVRMSDHGHADAQRILDAGAAGLLFPHVLDGDHAARVMRQFLFPPLGTRGQGTSSRAGLWGRLDGGLSEYVRVGNDEVLRIAMVEDASAVGHAPAIATAEGVNGLFVGPADLALSMGVKPGTDELRRAVDDCVRAGVRAGVYVGTVASSPERIRELADLGCHYLMIGNDTGTFTRAVTGLVETMREHLDVAGAAGTGDGSLSGD